MSAIVKYPKLSNLVALVLALFVTLGCGPVRLVSPYDQLIDQGITDFHTKLATFIGKVVPLAGKPEGSYEANKDAYPEFAAQLSTLKLRAAQTPKDDITVKAIDELVSNVERLRQLHQSGAEKGLPQALAGPALAAIDVQCESILKFEIAKKRGEDAQ